MKQSFIILMLVSSVMFWSCANSSDRNDSYQNVVVETEEEDDDVSDVTDVEAEETPDPDSSAYKFMEAYRDYRRLDEKSTVKMNRAQIAELESEKKELAEQAVYWGSQRIDELRQLIDEAELSGDYDITDKYKNELSDIEEKIQNLGGTVNDADDNTYNNEDDEMNDDSEDFGVSDTDY